MALLVDGYGAGLGIRRSLRPRSRIEDHRAGSLSQYSPNSYLSPLINRNTFIDQLFQFIQCMLREIDKPNPKGLIDRPLHLSVLDQNRCIIPRDNQFDGNLSSWLNNESAFNPGPAE